MLKERVLKLHDRVRDFEDSLLALVDRLHQPSRGTKPLLQVLLGARFDRAVVEDALVVVREPQPRHRALVQRNDKVVADLLNENIGNNIRRVLATVITSRLGFEHRDHLGRLTYLIERNLKRPGDLGIAMLFEKVEMVQYD